MVQRAGIYSIRGQGRTVTPMTEARVDSFLADVLALEGENPDTIREGVQVALGDCEGVFKAQEVNRRMKDKAATLAAPFAAFESSKTCGVGRERPPQST
jgi:hypothetical protein